MIEQKYRNITDPAAYREFILHSVVFKVGAPPKK